MPPNVRITPVPLTLGSTPRVVIKEEPREDEKGREIRAVNQPLEPEIFGVPEGESVEEHIAKVRTVGNLLKTALILPMHVRQSNGRVIILRALVDTGCKLNLIRKGFVAPEFFRPATTRFRLVTASGAPLAGGEREIRLGLVAKGWIEGSGEALHFEFPTTLLEADITVDVILSFSWLVDFDVDVRGRKYVLQTNTMPRYFIPGVEGKTEGREPVKEVRIIQQGNMVRQRNQ